MLLTFLLGGGIVLLGVWSGAAVVNLTNAVERRNDRLDTPEEKANRQAYRARKESERTV
jgi:hypothetical protein